ncbi:hypothetical protein TNCV_969731 [Trichonephila clavipes]|nr:hypothetical protein TNCV_969731 [Trichonephila clavipes]
MASLNSTPVAPPVVDIIKKYQEILKPSVKGNFGSRRFMLGKNGIATYYFIDKLVHNNLLLLEFLRESGLIKRGKILGGPTGVFGAKNFSPKSTKLKVFKKASMTKNSWEAYVSAGEKGDEMGVSQR